ncbi:tetratricopeptide repeat protein [Luteolibacter pohnpeiensis]|uniref:Tetratricopeptide repeat protein n=1 Tax=Luteolibacter pohnpeiensis TaxID=454153 RepID=A0A934SE17_9BACT|nr:tetratricopeptide repeat protein [Luteolibacter pohnpeiensis]MBK1883503.1 tetratricopeptide repeat protein [Luteolibacter pohnpeiensis]
MKGWLGVGILLAAIAAFWMMFARSGVELAQMDQKISAAVNAGDPDYVVPALKDERETLEGQRILNGIILTLVSAGLIGILFSVYVLPTIADRISQGIFGSGAPAEPDPMHDARVLIGQGDFEGAIEVFRAIAEQRPDDRVPWMEMAKLQREELHEPMEAIATLHSALLHQKWSQDDEAFFQFRIAEIFEESLGDRGRAALALKKVIEKFPDSRHAGNARHKLQEWGMS